MRAGEPSRRRFVRYVEGPTEDFAVPALLTLRQLFALATPAEMLGGLVLESRHSVFPPQIGRSMVWSRQGGREDTRLAHRGSVSLDWVARSASSAAGEDPSRRHRELINVQSGPEQASAAWHLMRAQGGEGTPIPADGLGAECLVTAVNDPGSRSPDAPPGLLGPVVAYFFLFRRGPVVALSSDYFGSHHINFERSLFLAHALDQRIADALAAGKSPMR